MKRLLERYEIHALSTLLAVALVLRLALPLALFLQGRAEQACMEPDSHDYLLLSRYISGQPVHWADPWGFRVPGYPLFLAPFSSLEGASLCLPVAIVQAFLDLGSCFLTWLIVRRRLGFGASSSLLALLLQCLSSSAIDSSVKLLSETLFTFLLLASLWLLIPALAKDRDGEASFKRRTQWLFGAGALWGLACLVRVVILPLTLLPALAACLPSRRLFPALVFLAPVLVLNGGWALRNGLTSGYWGVSSAASVNLCRYDACAVEASLSRRPFADVQRDFDSFNSDALQRRGNRHLAPESMERAVATIKAHPFEFAKVRLKGAVSTLLPSDGDLLKTLGFGVGGNGTLATIQSEGFVAGVLKFFGNGTWLIVLVLPSLALLALKYALAASWPLGVGSLRGVALPLCVVSLCVAWLVVAGGAASTPRFRVPAEPLLAILAAAAWTALASRFLRGKEPV